ncbi:MAG: hypothetical protein LBI95_03005 [Holosporales bacterium]|nr:hypothetical protein [Holosporales bacterium]
MAFLTFYFFEVIYCGAGQSSSDFSKSDSEITTENLERQLLLKNLKESITTKTISVICLKRNSNGNGIPLNEAKIRSSFRQIERNIRDDRWYLVVFSEHFFSRNPPLDNSQANRIIEQCNILTNRHPKLILHVTLLHEFNIKDENTPVFLKDTQDCINIKPTKNHFDSDSAKNFDLLKKKSDLHVANYSVTFFRGAPISIYRKGLYCKEANELIFYRNYVYEFGNWKDNIIPELRDDSIQKLTAITLFHQRLIATRICADINADIIFSKKKLLPKLNNGFLLHPANDIHIRPKIDCIFVDTNNGSCVSWSKIGPLHINVEYATISKWAVD